jgi:hypothetical protein
VSAGREGYSRGVRGVAGYAKRHHVGLLALFVALGGVSYAAVNLPKNSVGTKQIKAGAVGPADLGKVATSRVRTDSQRTISHGSPTYISFDEVVENTGKFANLESRPTALVAKRTGVYLLQAQLEANSLPAQGRVIGSIQLRRADGSFLDSSVANSTPAADAQFLTQPMSAVERLKKGQQVGLNVYQDTGENVTLPGTDAGTWLSMTYLGK